MIFIAFGDGFFAVTVQEESKLLPFIKMIYEKQEVYTSYFSHDGYFKRYCPGIAGKGERKIWRKNIEDKKEAFGFSKALHIQMFLNLAFGCHTAKTPETLNPRLQGHLCAYTKQRKT